MPARPFAQLQLHPIPTTAASDAGESCSQDEIRGTVSLSGIMHRAGLKQFFDLSIITVLVGCEKGVDFL